MAQVERSQGRWYGSTPLKSLAQSIMILVDCWAKPWIDLPGYFAAFMGCRCMCAVSAG